MRCVGISMDAAQLHTDTDTDGTVHYMTLYLVKVYEVQSAALHHGLLGVHHGEEQGVEALVLVQTSCSYCL